MHAAKLQLLVVANCNLLDYIQSLHAQSSWIDAKSGIATDFDTNSLVPKRKTQPTAACFWLMHTNGNHLLCVMALEHVHESSFSGFTRSLWPQAIHECCVCPNYLTPFPYSPYMDKTSPVNFITISTFKILFQISFQNLHLFYHYLYQWKSHPVCKMQLRVFRICDDNHPTDLQTATAH